MPTVKENLVAAKALIDTPEKWLKGALTTGDGTCFCAMGAVGAAGGYNLLSNDTNPELAALIDSIPADFQLQGGRHQLVEFNDHPDTTHADVMALFDRAIAAADAVDAISRAIMAAKVEEREACALIAEAEAVRVRRRMSETTDTRKMLVNQAWGMCADTAGIIRDAIRHRHETT